MPPQLTTSLDLHAVLLEAVDDRQRAEGRGLDQRAVDLRRAWCGASGRAAGRSAADRPGSCGCRCSSRGPAGPDSPGLSFAAAARQRLVRAGLLAAGLDVVDEPVEDVADGRLARPPGRSSRAGSSRARCRRGRGRRPAARRVGRDHHVAGAGADDLDQRARRDAGADGAQVRVERADGHGNARRQAGALAPTRRSGRRRRWSTA